MRLSRLPGSYKRPSPDRPGAVQGAKRRSGPLTARPALESLRDEGKGLPKPVPFSLPSAPPLWSFSEPSRRDK